MQIHLPHNGWTPRAHQQKLWCYLEQGGKRAIAVCHRRWGKDEVALHYTATAMAERPATYWHTLPMANQGRRAIWEAVNPHTGQRRIDEAFPRELRDVTRENEMTIRFKNGATWHIVGSDNYDSLVGSPPYGVVYSEWALADPASWAYLRPILAENGGWALFITTPRGQNHAKTMYDKAGSDPGWYRELSPATDTGVFTPDQLALERREYMAQFGAEQGRALYDQEYLCSFDAAVLGAFYAEELRLAREQKRIGIVPVDKAIPVHTAWDLGFTDATAIWFVQVSGREVRLVDYHEESGAGLDRYARLLDDKRREHGWRYANGSNAAQNWFPHDVEHRELGTGLSRRQTLEQLGISANVVPIAHVMDGINAVRRLLGRAWIDEKRCERGIAALSAYRREWDDVNRIFKAKPLHDWCLSAGTQVLTADGWRAIEAIKVHDQVLTLTGKRRILRSGIVRETGEWTVVQGIRCTPEHRFFTNRGLVDAGALLSQDRLWTRGSLGLSILAYLSATFRLGLKAAIILATPEGKTPDEVPSAVQSSFIAWSMRLCMALFRRAMKSITSTTIRSITTHPTLLYCREANIAANINPSPDMFASAGYAGKSSAATSGLARVAAKTADASITPTLRGNVEPAYNLSVEIDECYFVRGSDGAAYLVANSSHGADALRTFAQGFGDDSAPLKPEYDRGRYGGRYGKRNQYHGNVTAWSA